MIGTFTKTPSTAATLKLVLTEVRALLDQPPTPAELSLHRRSFLGSAAARFETPEQVADQLARISLNNLPLDHVQRTLAAISSTEAPQCQSLARRLVDVNHLLIVVVGDASRIGDELKAIAPVTVVERSH
jgi:predicted Zn-dependent peptidase